MRAFSIVLLLVLVQVAALAEPPAQSSSAPNNSPREYARRCVAKIKGMTAAHELTEWQRARIENLLSEHDTIIDLFCQHGLLGESELRKKVSTIQEVTRFNIDDVFSPDQLGIWKAWDLKLDAVDLQRPRLRHRLLSAP